MIDFNKEWVKESCLAKNEKCLGCKKSYISELENLSTDGVLEYLTTNHINPKLVDSSFEKVCFNLRNDFKGGWECIDDP